MRYLHRFPHRFAAAAAAATLILASAEPLPSAWPSDIPGLPPHGRCSLRKGAASALPQASDPARCR